MIELTDLLNLIVWIQIIRITHVTEITQTAETDKIAKRQKVYVTWLYKRLYNYIKDHFNLKQS